MSYLYSNLEPSYERMDLKVGSGHGKLLQETGASTDPIFLWVGSMGYQTTSRDYSESYVRARHYSTITCRWTTADPMGYQMIGNLHNYANSLPTTETDASGWISGRYSHCPPMQFRVTKDYSFGCQGWGAGWDIKYHEPIPVDRDYRSIDEFGIQECDCDRKKGAEMIGSNIIKTFSKFYVRYGIGGPDMKFSCNVDWTPTPRCMDQWHTAAVIAAAAVQTLPFGDLMWAALQLTYENRGCNNALNTVRPEDAISRLKDRHLFRCPKGKGFEITHTTTTELICVKCNK